MSRTDDRDYYAVLAAGQVTYWARNKRGQIVAWPSKARYEPALRKNDIPADLTAEGRRAFIIDFYEREVYSWRAQIRTVIAEDPEGCQARFAVFTSRCFCCGRALTDPASKTYGVGPDCRREFPPGLLAECARRMGLAHAEALEVGAA